MHWEKLPEAHLNSAFQNLPRKNKVFVVFSFDYIHNLLENILLKFTWVTYYRFAMNPQIPVPIASAKQHHIAT